MDADDSSQPADVQSNVTASTLPPIPVAVSRGRGGAAGGRGTATATSLRGAATGEVPSASVQDCAGASEGGAVSTPSAVSTRDNASGGTANSVASVQSSKGISDEDDTEPFA